MKTRYASWGTDKTFNCLWQAALADAIFAFRSRYKRDANVKRKQVKAERPSTTTECNS